MMNDLTQLRWWSMGLTDADPQAFEALANVCGRGEIETAARFRFERDRRAYLAAHGLLRHALSAADPRHAPAAWSFVRGAHGRPELDPRVGSGLRFNLSHCATRVACVVTPELDCGIDVEPAGREVDIALMGEQCLSAAERSWVQAAGAAPAARRFMRLWTLKEAVAKAVGLGLSLPLASLGFEVEPALRLVERPAGVGPDWWLVQAATDDGHIEALALALPAPRTVVLSRREWPHPARLSHSDGAGARLGAEHPEHDRARDGLLARYDA